MFSEYRRQLIALVGCCLVVSLIAFGSGAAAQPAPSGTPSNGTATNTAATGPSAAPPQQAPTNRQAPTQSSGNGNTGGSGSGGGNGNGNGGLLGGMGSVDLNPVPPADEVAADFVRGGVKWIVKSLVNGVNGFVNGFNKLMFDLPAPGQADKPQTWLTPNNGWWPGITETYGLMSMIGLLLLIGPVMRTLDEPNRQRRAEYGKELGIAAGMILFGWILLAAVLHIAGGLSMTIAPGGKAFTQTPSGVGKLSLGVIVGAVILFAKASVLLAGLLAKLGQWFLIQFLVAVWPLLWAFRVQPVSAMRSVGNGGIAAFNILVLLTFFQTGILRFLVNIPLVIPNTPVRSIVLSTIITAIGLVIGLLVLPYVAFKKAVPTAIQATSKKGWMQAKRNAKSTLGLEDDENPAPSGRGPDGGVTMNQHRTQTTHNQQNVFVMGASAPGGGGAGQHSTGETQSPSQSTHGYRRVGRLTQNSSPGAGLAGATTTTTSTQRQSQSQHQNTSQTERRKREPRYVESEVVQDD